jgi:hypothetical protein
VRPSLAISTSGLGTGAERLDQLDHQLAARGWVGVPVGGDHPVDERLDGSDDETGRDPIGHSMPATGADCGREPGGVLTPHGSSRLVVAELARVGATQIDIDLPAREVRGSDEFRRVLPPSVR